MLHANVRARWSVVAATMLVSFLTPILALALAPTLTISGVSSTSVAIGNEVTFSAVPNGFSSAVTYTVTDSFSGSSVSSSDVSLSGSFAWIPTSSDVGTHIITVQASDALSNSASATQTITVRAAPAVSIQPSVQNIVVLAGSPVFFSTSATGFINPVYGVSDPFPGSSLSSSAINTAGGFSWTPRTQDVGTHTITVMVTDSTGASASVSQYVTVSAAAGVDIQSLSPGAAVPVGQTVTFAAVPTSFTNPLFTISDSFLNSSVQYSSINRTLGTFSWAPVVADLGVHMLTVSASDSGGHFANKSIQIAVIAATSSVATAAVPTATPTSTVPPLSNSILPTVGSIVPTVTPVSVNASPNAPIAPGHLFKVYLERGASGADVTALQTILIRVGYLTSEATGYFGSLTEAAVKKYQAAHGFDTLGVVGPQTRAALNQEGDSGSFSSPSSGSSAPSSVGAGSGSVDQVQLLQSLLQQLQALQARIAALKAQ